MINILIISVILVFIDQIIKFVVELNMLVNSSINIISGFFNLTYVQNTGAAFSIFENKQLFLIIITIIALFFMFYFLKNKIFNKNEMAIYSLIVSGVLANLVDRIFRGYVVDYLDFKIFGYDFPIFNLADIMIVVGCILLALLSFLGDKNERVSNSKWVWKNR